MPKRTRSMSDHEIALAKSMIARGLKNDKIHFYFNRADRLISSGRIAQIRNGKYGAAVGVATPAELDAFLVSWQAVANRGPQATRSPLDTNVVVAMFEKVAGAWVLARGETDQVECKANFRLAPEYRFADVIKSVAGLANNKGGYIFFGVTDASLAVSGMTDTAMRDTDPAQINRTLAGALDPVPRIATGLIELGGKSVGVLFVDEHPDAPVIALKNIASDVKEGTIYFRYVGETRPIKPGELRQILAARERRAIAEFSRRMTRVASGEEATLNLATGEVAGSASRFLIDKDLLPRLQFIREGDFSETKGAPALKLIGGVEPVELREQQRVKVIRDAVTPDAVIRNFLLGENVASPTQYIDFQAHCQRQWLPIWFYVRQTKLPLDDLVESLRSLAATHPASRDSVVQRLRKTKSAYKLHVGKPSKLLADFLKGNLEPPSAADDLAFANAVMGLPDATKNAEAFKPILLASLDRSGQKAGGTIRSAIYRAASRIDELLV